MDLVNHYAAQVLEIVARPFPGAKEGQLFRGGQQDVGRGDPLALAAGLAGVAGAGFDHNGQVHLAHGRQQIAFHIHS